MTEEGSEAPPMSTSAINGGSTAVDGTRAIRLGFWAVRVVTVLPAEVGPDRIVAGCCAGLLVTDVDVGEVKRPAW